MKKAHLMLDTDRSHRLCDGKPVELPLPHCTDEYEICEKCEQKREASKTVESGYGLGVSFARK